MDPFDLLDENDGYLDGKLGSGMRSNDPDYIRGWLAGSGSRMGSDFDDDDDDDEDYDDDDEYDEDYDEDDEDYDDEDYDGDD
ncbi:MAG: hypothetical protein K6E33_00990, partial [Lachnospiraceae bacterium]|nr:hypothetical protein [Lachnospiraceae bacterium]